MRAGLEAEGYHVIEAGTAGEALDMLGTSVPGAIAVAVLDLKLPDSDGLTLLRRVRRAAPDCRVIIMTADGSPALLAEAVTAGAVGTVSKPFDPHPRRPRDSAGGGMRRLTGCGGRRESSPGPPPCVG